VDSVRVAEDDFAVGVMVVIAVVVETSRGMVRELEHRQSCKLVVHHCHHRCRWNVLKEGMKVRLR